jgi:hypothetical protein
MIYPTNMARASWEQEIVYQIKPMGKQRNAYDDKCTREGCWGYCQTLTEEARRRRSREVRMTVVPLMTTSGTLYKTRLGMEEIINPEIIIVISCPA